jgi:hypothetical protein
MNRLFSSLVITAACALVLVLPSPARGQAQTFTDQIETPVDVSLFIQCFDENVHFTGTDFSVVHVTVLPDGKVRVSEHFTLRGATAVGETTGTVYRFNYPQSNLFEFFGEPPYVENVVSTQTLLSPGPGPNAVVQFRRQLTIDENGEVTVTREIFETKCLQGQ